MYLFIYFGKSEVNSQMSVLVSALRDVDASFSTLHTTNKISTNCSVCSQKCLENEKISFSCPPGIFRAQIQFLGRTSRQHCGETGCEVTVGGADTTGSSDCRLDFKANNSELFPQLMPLLQLTLILNIVVLLLWGLRVVAAYQGDVVRSAI